MPNEPVPLASTRHSCWPPPVAPARRVRPDALREAIEVLEVRTGHAEQLDRVARADDGEHARVVDRVEHEALQPHREPVDQECGGELERLIRSTDRVRWQQDVDARGSRAGPELEQPGNRRRVADRCGTPVEHRRGELTGVGAVRVAVVPTQELTGNERRVVRRQAGCGQCGISRRDHLDPEIAGERDVEVAGVAAGRAVVPAADSDVVQRSGRRRPRRGRLPEAVVVVAGHRRERGAAARSVIDLDAGVEIGPARADAVAVALGDVEEPDVVAAGDARERGCRRRAADIGERAVRSERDRDGARAIVVGDLRGRNAGDAEDRGGEEQAGIEREKHVVSNCELRDARARREAVCTRSRCQGPIPRRGRSYLDPSVPVGFPARTAGRRRAARSFGPGRIPCRWVRRSAQVQLTEDLPRCAVPGFGRRARPASPLVVERGRRAGLVALSRGATRASAAGRRRCR